MKLAILARALSFRAAAPSLFMEGAYIPLASDGAAADHVIAFARVHEGKAVIAVAARFAANLSGVTDLPLPDAAAWQGTSLAIPRSLVGREVSDVLGGMAGPLPGQLPVGDALGRLPVALLEVR